MQDQPHSLVLVFWIQWQDNVKTTGDRLGCRSCQKMKHMVPSNHLRGCTPDWYKVYFIACPPLQRWLQGSGFSRWLPLTLQSQCPLTDLPLIFVKVSSYPLHQYPASTVGGDGLVADSSSPRQTVQGFRIPVADSKAWPDLTYRTSENLICSCVPVDWGLDLCVCTG